MAYIEGYAAANCGRLPTVREIEGAVGLVTSAVAVHLDYLVADGRLRRTRKLGEAHGYQIAGAAFLLPGEVKELTKTMSRSRARLAAGEARLAELEGRLASQAARLAAAEALMNGELRDLRMANGSLDESGRLLLDTLTGVIELAERHGYVRGGTATVSEWLEATLGGLAARREPVGARSRPN